MKSQEVTTFSRETREAVVSSGSFPEHDSQIPLELVVRLARFSGKKSLPLLPGCGAEVHHEEAATLIEHSRIHPQ